jgi:hypothetical protein
MLRLIRNLHSAIDDLAKKNADQSKAIETNLAQAISTETNPETKRILEDAQNDRKLKIAALTSAKSDSARDLRASTTSSTNELRRNAMDKKEVDGRFRESVGMTAQSEAIIRSLGDKPDANMVELIRSMRDVNIRSLLVLLSSPKANLQSMLAEFGTDEMTGKYKSNDKVIGMIKDG